MPLRDHRVLQAPTKPPPTPFPAASIEAHDSGVPGVPRCACGFSSHASTNTSSTAQGGGGSFKNGKPIGEVSWCDAKMAERTH